MKEIIQYFICMVKDTLSLLNVFDTSFTIPERILNFIIGIIQLMSYLIGIVCVGFLMKEAILKL